MCFDNNITLGNYLDKEINLSPPLHPNPSGSAVVGTKAVVLLLFIYCPLLLPVFVFESV